MRDPFHAITTWWGTWWAAARETAAKGHGHVWRRAVRRLLTGPMGADGARRGTGSSKAGYSGDCGVPLQHTEASGRSGDESRG